MHVCIPCVCVCVLAVSVSVCVFVCSLSYSTGRSYPPTSPASKKSNLFLMLISFISFWLPMLSSWNIPGLSVTSVPLHYSWEGRVATPVHPRLTWSCVTILAPKKTPSRPWPNDRLPAADKYDTRSLQQAVPPWAGLCWAQTCLFFYVWQSRPCCSVLRWQPRWAWGHNAQYMAEDVACQMLHSYK